MIYMKGNENDNYYGFTYKCNKKGYMPTAEDYEVILQSLRKRGTVIDYRYETDSKGKLHIHGVVQFDRCPYFKSLMFPYYAQRYELIYDLDGWTKYMTKIQHTVIESEQLADAVYARQHYLFDDDDYNLRVD